MDWALTITLGILGSGGFFSFLTYLMDRHTSKKKSSFTEEEKKSILDGMRHISVVDERLWKLEQSTDRLQLLNLIQNDPNNKDAIITLGEHYFQVLHGNMYMTSLFTDWAKSQGIDDQVIHEIIKK